MSFSMSPRIACLLGLVTTPLAAQDGGQLYTTHCSACHAIDGQGATGGTFPPLAGSPWVNSEAALAIQIVLHGLDGPVDLLGKTYNLAMPPQGAVLSDPEIAAILSYTRSSWGNRSSVVSPADVAAARKASTGRTKPWTAPELLKLHPLVIEKSALTNLTSQAYFGEWSDLPDFTQLKAENIEEENSGLISVRHGLRNDHFGVVWQAEFNAPEDGEYLFRLDCDDFGRVIVNGTSLMEIREIGPMGRAKEGKITLTKGKHPIRIEYAEAAGDQGISLAWKGPGMERWKPLSDLTSGGGGNPWPNIPIIPPTGEAVVYRNFIEGTTPRAIGIGLPGGVSFAWSADHFAPELVWTGLFMDGGRHWTDRGVGNDPPAGERIIKLANAPALATAAEAAERWPDRPALAARFRGYRFESPDSPTFSVEAAGLKLLDRYQAGAPDTLDRTLRMTGRPSEPLLLLLARGLPITPAGDGRFSLGDGLAVEVRSPKPARLLGDGSLVLPLDGDATAEIRYLWR